MSTWKGSTLFPSFVLGFGLNSFQAEKSQLLLICFFFIVILDLGMMCGFLSSFISHISMRAIVDGKKILNCPTNHRNF